MPKDNATRRSPFLKCAKVAGSHLEAPSPSFVNANRENEAITLIYEREGVCSVIEGIEKNYLGPFNDGTNWRHLLCWLGKSYVER